MEQNYKEILQTVAGCTIEFKNDTLPVQNGGRWSRFNSTQDQIIQDEVNKLLTMGVLELVESEPGEFVSPIFLVPKKSGTFRMILNLKNFNEYVEYFHFKMETFDIALRLISKGCFMASIDLKDAYYGVPVHEDYKQFLRFIWNGQLFQFTCLPNGLSCAPRKYTKIMKPVYATLRKAGHSIGLTGFLDDMLIVADSEQSLSDSVSQVVHTLKELGVIINFDKSVLKPTTRITHLGFEIDSNSMLVSLPIDKMNNITAAANNVTEESRYCTKCG